MKIDQIPFQKIPQLSSTDIAYQTKDNRLKRFYEHAVALENFGTVIKNKTFSNEKREILYHELLHQYKGIRQGASVTANMELLLKSNTYCVTTAHQPSLLTGPLYFIYKICSTINLCRTLKTHYPSYNFVPIYWMGGEDHDFEEINHIHLFNKTLKWGDQQGGAVGKYQTQSLQPVLKELQAILGEGENAAELIHYLNTAFENPTNYSQGLFYFIHQLFRQYGLLVLIPEAAAFKRQMYHIFEDDLLHHSSQILIEQTVQNLATVGFKNQAHVRHINLFYLLPNQRSRIVQNGDFYEVLNTEIRWTKEELLQNLKDHPECFSPNVILRPLYQETILPNLAYIGGGGELAYWLERKTQFLHYQTPFPMLIRRNSVQFVDENSYKKLQTLNLPVQALFQTTDQLIRQYLAQQTQTIFSFDKEIEELQHIFLQAQTKVAAIDQSLTGALAAQEAQLKKSLKKLEQRLLRARKKKEETTIRQIHKIKDKLMPHLGLQERYDNFMPFFLKYGSSWIQFLVQNLNPLNPHFLLVIEEKNAI